MKRRVFVTGVVIAAIAALVVLVPMASAGDPQPLAPDQAQALVTGPSPVSATSLTRRASPQEALAAASIPGATTTVAPGMTLSQAAGVVGPIGGTLTTTSPLVKPAAADSVACESNVSGWHWGIWPYDQNITDTTYWCAVYGVAITYRTTSVTATGTFCGTSWTSSALISGGIGANWFTMRASAGWSCPTDIPWITLHPSHYLDTSHNAWGNSDQVRTG